MGGPCTLHGSKLCVINGGVSLSERTRFSEKLRQGRSRRWRQSSNFRSACGGRFLRRCSKSRSKETCRGPRGGVAIDDHRGTRAGCRRCGQLGGCPRITLEFCRRTDFNPFMKTCGSLERNEFRSTELFLDSRLEVFERQLAESGMGPPHYPRCGFQGRRIKRRGRTLQTRRGLKAPPSEPECALYGFLCQRRVVCYLLVKDGIRSSNRMAK